jgi:hypothetical protein
LEDRVVYADEGFLAADVPVIVGPSPDEGIELPYQMSRCRLLVSLDDSSDFAQERLHILLGGRYQELASVLAHLLSEKVESVLDVGGDGFLPGEFQTALLQELGDQWFDPFFQQRFGVAGDEKVE